MPRKKQIETPEEELELKLPQKKKSFARRWFDEYAVNDKTDLKIICDLTARSMGDQFGIYLKSGNTECYGVIFYSIFMEIMKFIKSKQKEKYHKQFMVEIANSVNLGYVNNTDEDNEKVGNFMPIMEYININRNINPPEDKKGSEYVTSNLIDWKNINAHQNVEYYKTIEQNAYQVLWDEFNIRLRTQEAVIPCFCIFMDNITNYLKKKYEDLKDTDVSEVSINVFGLFDAYYSYDEDNPDSKDIIEYQPGIALKLALKQDDVAAGD